MCTGEVTVALSAGVDTHTDPWLVVPGSGGGRGAGNGNGATPEVGPTLSATVTTGHDEFDVGDGDWGGFPLPPPLLPPLPQEVIVISVINAIPTNRTEHHKRENCSTRELLFSFKISQHTSINILQNWAKRDTSARLFFM